MLHTEPGVDFSGVAYSTTRQRVYVFDGSGGRVLWATFVPAQTTIGPWKLLADASTIPELGLPNVRWTGRMHIEDGATPTLVLVSSDWWSDIPTVRIQDTTG
jgi:hypothetical protein